MDTQDQRDRTGSLAALTDPMKREQLERVLASPVFSNSHHLRHFLQYVSDQTLAGHNDEITEYLIAARVFGKEHDFDPGSDTVVRTQAYRLRTKLKEYYESAGSEDPVVIEIPKGRYIPTFSLREGSRHPAPQPESESSEATEAAAQHQAGHLEKTARARPGRILVLAAAQVVLLLAAMLAGWSLHHRSASGRIDPQDTAASFWASFLEDDRKPIVAFSNGVYLASEYGDLLRFRGSTTGDRGGLVSAEEAAHGLTNRGLAGKTGPLHFDDGITGTGDLEAAARITGIFMKMGLTASMKRSRLITTDDLREHNVVFLGSPFDNLVLRDIAHSERIVFDFTPEERQPKLWGNLIRDLDGGPQAAYGAECDPNTGVLKADHAVISVLPSIVPNRRVMILAGLTTTGTQGATEFSCSGNYVSQLLARLGGKSLPRYFQCILRVEAAHGLDVTRMRLVAGRAIQPD